MNKTELKELIKRWEELNKDLKELTGTKDRGITATIKKLRGLL